ncbi:hypothetical protein BH10PSE9_BH10PSE9_17450 [soil metagenome]
MDALRNLKPEVGATAAFAAAGVVGLLVAPGGLPSTAATALFYAVLLLNTFLSIRFFRVQRPYERDERVVDAVLAVAYLALGVSIGRVTFFLAASLVLFVAAVAKYVRLVNILELPHLARRKIFLNFLGVVLCGGSLAIALAGYPVAGAWIQAAIFTLANVYLLAIKPMYVV